MASKGTGTSGTLILTLSIVSVNKATRTYVVRCIAQIKNTSSSTFTGGTSWSVETWGRSGVFQINGVQTVTLMNETTSIQLNSDGDARSVAQTLTMGATGTSGLGGPTSLTTSITLPRITQAPTSPTTPSVSRVSDTQQNISWTRRASDSAPYGAQQIQRRTFGSSGWSSFSTIATIGTDYFGTGNHSYSDKTTVANRAYQYRIRATNSAGEAVSGISVVTYTTPAAPSSLVATKLSGGDIRLVSSPSTLVNNQRTELRYSTNGGTTWTTLTNLANDVNSYVWENPPSVPSVVFDARTVIESSGSVGNGLASARRQSNAVVLTTPPAAPSALSPNGVVYDAVNERTFSWQHNTIDSSEQSAYEIRYRIVGGEWTTTGKVISDVSTQVFPSDSFENGNQYQWEVRTWGAHADPGPYSATAAFTASASPSASITFPGDVLDTSLLTATWEYFDPEETAQSQWEARLYQGENQLEFRNGSGTGTSVAFTSTLQDNFEYQVQVRVRDGSGLWSDWDQKTFTTDFPLPPTPEVTAIWQTETGFVLINITNPEGTPEVVNNIIQRSLDQGATWHTVGEAPPNGQGFDITVPLVGEVWYVVEAWSELPSVAASQPVVFQPGFIPDEEGQLVRAPVMGYWSVGQQALQMKMGYRNPPKIDMSTGRHQKTLHYFAGRTSAVETIGEAIAREGSVKFMVGTEAEMHACREMALLPAPHLFRLPDGTFVFASIADVSDKRLDEGFYDISFKITEVSA